jgi:hypothetical protein
MLGGRADVRKAGPFQGTTSIAAEQRVEVHLHQDGGAIVDGAGHTGQPQPAHDYRRIVLLDWSSNGWQVVGIAEPS